MNILSRAWRTAAVVVVVAAASTPLAQAAPTGPNPLDGRALPCAPSCARDLFDPADPVNLVGGAGFDWADAAAGFGLGVATLFVAGGLTLVLRQRRTAAS
jgi:hypothetical protein